MWDLSRSSEESLFNRLRTCVREPLKSSIIIYWCTRHTTPSDTRQAVLGPAVLATVNLYILASYFALLLRRFCYDCLDKLVVKGHHSCPTCRVNVDMRSRTEEISLENEIKKKAIQCSACQNHVRCNTGRQACQCTLRCWRHVCSCNMNNVNL